MASNRRVRKKNIAKSTNEMSKEMLFETLKKKKECNAKALAIVERLCDTSSFDEKWLLTNLEFINQAHFNDVIIERAILKLCGYPLCNGKLENVPSKKYHISTVQNKVYDLTERKNFCSNICYKAGMYLKSQLLTSPLWVREHEIIPKFQLLPCNSTSSMGQEIVFLLEKEKIKEEVLSEKRNMDFCHVEKVCDLIDSMMLNREDVSCVRKSEETNGGNDNINNSSDSDKKVEVCEQTRVKSLVKEIDFDEKSKNIEGSKEVVKEEKMIAIDPVKKVEQSIYEWFSFDTVLYLYGEEKVKDLIKDRKGELKDIIGKKSLVPGYNERIDGMIKFYSLLEQQAFDSDFLKKNLRPLPDYSAIKEDGKKLQVKVTAFYSGQFEVCESDVVEKEKEGINDDNEEEKEIYLPTVDTHAQNSLRIKILLDRFNRIIPELIRTFTRANCFETSELRNLVNHFTLSAHNITFKPGEWYLIGFIVVKLLSVRNKQLESLLKSETGRKNVTLFLMNYNLPADYLDNILEWLVNAESLIRKLK